MLRTTLASPYLKNKLQSNLILHDPARFTDNVATNMASTPPELTPAEEAAARAKEQAEQDALPYKWTQTIGDVDITISVPGNYKGRDLNVDIKKQKIVAGIKGQDPIISVRGSSTFYHPLLLSGALADAFCWYRAICLMLYTLMTRPGRSPAPPTTPR